MIPLGEAMWIQLTGSQMTAQRAYDVGPISVPPARYVFTEAELIASEIKKCAPLAVQAIKHIVKAGMWHLPVEYSWELASLLPSRLIRLSTAFSGDKGI